MEFVYFFFCTQIKRDPILSIKILKQIFFTNKKKNVFLFPFLKRKAAHVQGKSFQKKKEKKSTKKLTTMSEEEETNLGLQVCRRLSQNAREVEEAESKAKMLRNVMKSEK